MVNKFLDLIVEDLEIDVLKVDMNVYLLFMEELIFRLKDFFMFFDFELSSF